MTYQAATDVISVDVTGDAENVDNYVTNEEEDLSWREANEWSASASKKNQLKKKHFFNERFFSGVQNSSLERKQIPHNFF